MSLEEELERNWPRLSQGAALDHCGPYLLKAELASGSMGIVYLAQHELTRAEAAVKLLRPELMTHAESRDRFLREVSAASRIGHPGVVQVFDAGVDQHGRYYIAMERLHGDDFCNRLASGSLTVQEALGIVHDLLDPLIAAHDVGLVHRDLKPENVFILETPGPSRVKLLDFGIVRELDQKSATATGLVVGTPNYMSPEQAMRPRTVGPAADIWAVGVMMYEVLTGRVPFDGESAHAVVVHACNDPHVPVHVLAPHVDRRLSQLVDRCLSKDPAERPAHARALKQDLTGLLSTQGLDVRLRPRADALPFPATPSHQTNTQSFAPSRSLNPAATGTDWRRVVIFVAAALVAVSSGWLLSRKTRPAPAVAPTSAPSSLRATQVTIPREPEPRLGSPEQGAPILPVEVVSAPEKVPSSRDRLPAVVKRKVASDEPPLDDLAAQAAAGESGALPLPEAAVAAEVSVSDTTTPVIPFDPPPAPAAPPAAKASSTVTDTREGKADASAKVSKKPPPPAAPSQNKAPTRPAFVTF